MRAAPSFGDRISREPGAKFPPAAGRYHLYINLACPWATAAFTMLELKGLGHAISVSTTCPVLGEID